MKLNQDRLTLDGLLADPLTQLVMRSDKLTAADVRDAFARAEAGLRLQALLPDLRPAPALNGQDWLA